MHWDMHWSHNAGGGRCSVGVGAGARSERACGCRRTREPDTTLSPRLRASARLLFPGRRPIATGAAARARAVGNRDEHSGRERSRRGGVHRGGDAGWLTC